MMVAGQTVTVNQAAGDPVFGNWGGTIVKGSGCPATLPASVEYTGTIRRTGGATNEFVISIPAVGVQQPDAGADHQRQQPAVLRADRHALYLQRHVDERSAIARRDIFRRQLQRHLDRDEAVEPSA